MSEEHLAYEFRMACMRLSRRVRYTTQVWPPHFFSVLGWLGDGPMTAAELAAKERISAASMSRTVTEMTERGLIERTCCADDKRRYLLTITEAGRAAVDEGRAERTQWMADHLGELCPEDLAALRRATDIINRLLEEDPRA